jgi:hypothetical protein
VYGDGEISSEMARIWGDLCPAVDCSGLMVMMMMMMMMKLFVGHRMGDKKLLSRVSLCFRRHGKPLVPAAFAVVSVQSALSVPLCL